MPNINNSSSFQADIVNFIQKKTLPLTEKQLVAYQFGEKLKLERGHGVTYTASRYTRLNLPFAPLSEGVPPVGEALTLQQVTAVAQQWGDAVYVTDVAELTIYHPLFEKAIELVALQVAETLDRNTYNVLLGGTQVNYVGSVGARASLTTTSYLTAQEVTRANSVLRTIGAPQFMGQNAEDAKIEAGKPSMASKDPRGRKHYVAIVHTNVESDLRTDSTIVTAWSYSDINKLYNEELGEWGGIRWTSSNMVPFFTGVAAVTATGHTTGGSLADGTYYTQVTGSVVQNGYEQLVYQVASSVTITGGSGNGSITLTAPSTAGFVYNVYVDTAASPAHLGLSSSGPSTGSLAGNAVQIPASTSVTITGIGAARTPPAAPATGVTVYPTFIIGKDAYGQVELENIEFFYLKNADKSDIVNQLRVVSWKNFYGTLIENQQFFMRVESASRYNGTFA